MSKKERGRLGRGLEALIPQKFNTREQNNKKETVIEGLSKIAIKDISENPQQPRKDFDEQKLKELSDSIKQHGLAQPVLVREKNGKYELIAGERRLKACIMAKMTDIEVIIKKHTDKESAELALIENIQREDLNIIELAEGYQKMLNKYKYTHKALSQLFNKSRSAITNTIRLIKLPEEVKQALIGNKISEGHAKALMGCKDDGLIISLSKEIIDNNLNVREIEYAINDIKKGIKNKPRPFNALELELNNRVNAKVKIQGTIQKGHISIQYKTEKEFERIKKLLLN